MRVKTPYKPRGEMYGLVKEMVGGSRVNVFCEDGKSRVGRIIGKMKKKVWIRPNDLVIIVPWTVQTDQKCDVIYRYIMTEKERLKKINAIPKEMII
tara:strand:+ start:781 stop:1068 length:288 start_codon:yes stop_codon:yes gene_type:complete